MLCAVVKVNDVGCDCYQGVVAVAVVAVLRAATAQRLTLAAVEEVDAAVADTAVAAVFQ